MMKCLTVAIAIAIAILLSVPVTADEDKDRHAGYYYPEPVTEETYVARAQTAADSTRDTRLGFVTALTKIAFARPYPPTYAIFAKGSDAEKLIIVSMGDAGFRTLYQARGLMAQMTAIARTTDLFRKLAVEDFFTFYDLLKLLGFRQLTISDGETFSHQIVIR